MLTQTNFKALSWDRFLRQMPDATMLNGNTVDYALIHNNLAPHTSMTTEWAVPWRPHCLVTYALELDDELPTVPDIDFRPWTTYVSQVEDIILYDVEPNQAARGLADWVSVTEQYLLQPHGHHK